MTNNIDVKNLIVSVDGGDSIGMLLLYTLPDKDYAIADTLDTFDELSLDKDKLPSNVKGLDVFHRVTKEITKATYLKKYRNGSLDTIGLGNAEFSVHDVKVNSQASIATRNLVIKRNKITNQEDSFNALDFEKEVVSFYHDNENELIGSLISEHYKNNELIIKIVDEAKEMYTKKMNYYSYGQVKPAFRKMLYDMRAISLVNGYFVTNEFRDYVFNFAEGVRKLGGRAIVLNMMDGSSDREQLKTEYLTYVNSMVQRVQSGFHKKNELGERPPKRDVEALLRSVKEANEDYAKFVELLRMDEEELRQGQERLKEVTLELMNYVDEWDVEILRNKEEGRKKAVATRTAKKGK